MKKTEHTSQPEFDNARMLGEGSFTTPQGNVVHTYYVDLAGKQLPEGLCLVKISEPQFDLRTADSVRLPAQASSGKPAKFSSRTSRRDGSGGPARARNQRGLATLPREPVCQRLGEDEKDAYRSVGIDVREGLADLLHVPPA